MINILAAVDATSMAYFYGKLTGGLVLSLVIASILAFGINKIFKNYQKNNIVIPKNALFYKRMGILLIYICAVLCALGKILVLDA